jgi:selenide,water dikinase
MRNPQPAFGLAVTGFVGLDSIVTLGKARPGQRIILTKALGTGLYIRALRDSLLTLKQASCAVDQMLTLNRAAGAAAVSSGIQAGTDVTGFGLLGHLSEVMAASRTGALIRVSHVPTLPRAHEFAAIGLSTSNTEPNWWAVRDRVVAHYALAERDRLVLSSPETSGGLLLFADPEQLRIFTGEAAGRFSFTVIGEVTEGSTIELAR